MDWLKTIHVSSIILSFSGFFLRGFWILTDSSYLQNRWVKTLPHIIDAVLLTSAILMIWLFHWSIMDNPWLQVKITALLVYIVLGTIAIKPNRPKKVRMMAWLLALLVFVFIVSVALSKSAYGFFS